MREETRVAAEACLAAVGTAYTADEAERLRRPPYPSPDRLLPHRDVALAEVERLRRDGRVDGTCVKTTMETYLHPWSTLADRLAAYTATFRLVQVI